MTEIAEKAFNMAMEAKEDVSELRQKQDGHEDICGLRYDQLYREMKEIKENQKMMFNRHMAEMVFMVIVLVGAVGTGITIMLSNADDRLQYLEDNGR